MDLVPAPPVRRAEPKVGALRRLLDRTGEVIVAGAKESAFPVLVLLLALFFLLVQDRVDRRDPKLALAPVHADPDLTFRQPEDRP